MRSSITADIFVQTVEHQHPNGSPAGTYGWIAMRAGQREALGTSEGECKSHESALKAAKNWLRRHRHI